MIIQTKVLKAIFTALLGIRVSLAHLTWYFWKSVFMGQRGRLKIFLLFLAPLPPWRLYFPSRIPQIGNIEVSASTTLVKVVSTFPIKRCLSRLYNQTIKMCYVKEFDMEELRGSNLTFHN